MTPGGAHKLAMVAIVACGFTESCCSTAAEPIRQVKAQLSARQGAEVILHDPKQMRVKGHTVLCGFYGPPAAGSLAHPWLPFGFVDGRLVEQPLHMIEDLRQPTTSDLATICLTRNFTIPPL